MYISEIEIQNFRSFSNSKAKIEFTEGTNVIIGHNNAGKTNLIKALQLIFDSRKSKSKLTVDDFNKEYTDFSMPPEINITVTLKEQISESKDDKVVVYDWITSPGDKYEAKLTFSFFLPQGDDYNDYTREIEQFKNEEKYDSVKAWRFIKKYFFSKYIARIYGGIPENKETADNEMLNKFDFQFLDAIRDAEKQMFFGSNTILKDVLNYFLDFDITDGKKLKDLSAQAKAELKTRETDFSDSSDTLLTRLKERISKNNILKYAEKTGANKGGNPDFDVNVSEEDLLFALRLIVGVGAIKIPISNNGLGCNNLLYIALVLSKIQIESKSSYYGENAKVFPILAIEEPEAHLHPSMQFKLLKFLKENVNKEGKVRQLFVTTHSTHITSAAELDNIICLYNGLDGKAKVGYPGKAFGKHVKSKNYVKRFLDATKSNMLFADRIMMVEGLSEQLLIPCLAGYSKKDDKVTNEDELINQHVCTVSVDSRTFKHFLRLYSYSSDNLYAIEKRVVCITDADPEIKDEDNKWRGCFPFQLKEDDNSKSLASHVTELKSDFAGKFKNIFVFHPKEKEGKTLEYELVRYNPLSDLIFTNCFPSEKSPHTIENFKKLQAKYNKDNKGFISLINLYESFLTTKISKDKFAKLKEEITACDITEEEKTKSFLAAIYYNIVKSLKGEHAFFLEQNLRKDLEKNSPEFIVPEYINDAITKVLE